MQRRAPDDAVPFNKAAAAHLRARHWEKALLIPSGMLAEPVVPDAITASTTAKACASGGGWRLACCLLASLLEQHARLDMVTLNAAARGCRRAWQASLWLLLGVAVQSALEPDVVSLSTLLTMCSPAHADPRDLQGAGAASVGAHWVRSFLLLRMCRRSGLQLDAVVSNALASACAAASGWESGLAVTRVMPRLGLRLDVFSHTVSMGACARCLQWMQALRSYTALQCHSTRASAVCLSSVIASLGKSYNWAATISSLSVMVRDGPWPDAVAFSTVSAACTLSAQWRPAVWLVRRMQGGGGVAPALNEALVSSAIGACGSELLWREAFDVWQRASRDGLRPSVVTFGALAVCLSAAGRWAAALCATRAVQATLLQPNVVCWTAVVGAQARGQHPATIPSLVAAVRGSFDFSRAETDLAVTIADALEDHGVLRFAEAEVLKRRVLKPVHLAMRGVCKPAKNSSTREGRVLDGVLERQHSLGATMTGAALAVLRAQECATSQAYGRATFGSGADDTLAWWGLSNDAGASWLPSAGLLSRSTIWGADELPRWPQHSEPSARRMACWTSVMLPPVFARRVCGYGRLWGEADAWLQAVVKEHDRSLHAERLALVATLSMLLAA